MANKESILVINPFQCWVKGCKEKPIGLKQFNPDFWRIYSCRKHTRKLDKFENIKEFFDFIDKVENERQ